MVGGGPWTWQLGGRLAAGKGVRAAALGVGGGLRARDGGGGVHGEGRGGRCSGWRGSKRCGEARRGRVLQAARVGGAVAVEISGKSSGAGGCCSPAKTLCTLENVTTGVRVDSDARQPPLAGGSLGRREDGQTVDASKPRRCSTSVPLVLCVRCCAADRPWSNETVHGHCTTSAARCTAALLHCCTACTALHLSALHAAGDASAGCLAQMQHQCADQEARCS